MIKEPKIGKYLDEEEKSLVEAIEDDAYETGKSFLSASRLEELQAAAKATINEKRVKISLRLPESDLNRLKARALKNGMPYQTLINSILHKAAIN
jgi:predicted DNA binding CopG/RHH family protein